MDNPTKQELQELHGTPEEFAEAVWRACDELFCTVDEAVAAIDKYQKEWDQAE